MNSQGASGLPTLIEGGEKVKRWEEQMKKGKVPMGRGGNARNTCSVQKFPS